MPTDIVIHTKGFLTFNSYVYINITEHSIIYTDKFVNIRFNYIPKSGKRKGKLVHYEHNIPIDSLYRVSVRNYE